MNKTTKLKFITGLIGYSLIALSGAILQAQEKVDPHNSSAITEDSHSTSFECYMLKYPDSLDVPARLQSDPNWMNKVIAHGFEPGLFSHTGGGPEGSHWNIFDDIFCFYFSSSGHGDQIQKAELKITGRRLKLPYESLPWDPKEGFVIAFRVPNKSLRKRVIRKEDLPLLYHDKPKEEWLQIRDLEVADVQLVLVWKDGHKSTARGLIHLSYGE